MLVAPVARGVATSQGNSMSTPLQLPSALFPDDPLLWRRSRDRQGAGDESPLPDGRGSEVRRLLRRGLDRGAVLEHVAAGLLAIAAGLGARGHDRVARVLFAVRATARAGLG